MSVMLPKYIKGAASALYLKEHSLLLPGKVLPPILYRGMTYKETIWPTNNQKHFLHGHTFTLHWGAWNTCPALFFTQITVYFIILLSLLIAWSHKWNKNIWIKGIHLAKKVKMRFATFLKKTHIDPPRAWLAKQWLCMKQWRLKYLWAS